MNCKMQEDNDIQVNKMLCFELRNHINADGEGDKPSPAVSLRQKEQTPLPTRSVSARRAHHF